MLNRPISISAVTATLRRQALVGEVRRQVHADEHDLEAADEEADREQHVAAMRERFAHRLGRRLLERRRRRRAASRPARAASGTIARPMTPSAISAPYQPSVRQQEVRRRQHRELSERAGGRRDAERHAALLRRKASPEHAGDDRERESREPGADEHARREHEHQRRRRVRHREQAEHVEDRAGEHDLRRADSGRRACRRTAASRPT